MRRTVQLVTAGLAVALAGCTHKRVDGTSTVVTFEWWVPALVILAGLAAVPVGLFVRRKSFWGWLLLVAGPVVAVAVGPGFALDRVTVTPESFRLRTGFWFDPTVREVRFADLDRVTLTKTEKRGRRGRKNVSYDFDCARKAGESVRIPIGTLMDEGGGEAFLDAAAAAGVPLYNATGE